MPISSHSGHSTFGSSKFQYFVACTVRWESSSTFCQTRTVGWRKPIHVSKVSLKSLTHSECIKMKGSKEFWRRGVLLAIKCSFAKTKLALGLEYSYRCLLKLAGIWKPVALGKAAAKETRVRVKPWKCRNRLFQSSPHSLFQSDVWNFVMANSSHWRGVWNKALSDFWCNVKFS